MRNTIFTLVLIILTSAVFAEVPPILNYQGRLTDDAGNPLDATVSMTFTLYEDSLKETMYWSQTYPSVVITNGLFNVLLDLHVRMCDYPPPDLYLSIAVGGDPDISPPTRLVSTMYSLLAGAVDGFHSGENNIDSGLYTLVGGDYNTVRTDYGLIAGGFGNLVDGVNPIDTVLELCDTIDIPLTGFENNFGEFRHPIEICDWGSPADNPAPVVVGGKNNQANGMGSGVGWGASNTAEASYTSVVGGCSNFADGKFSFIGGGLHNHTDGKHSTIGGGLENHVFWNYGTVCGGFFNTAGKWVGGT